MKKLLQLLIVLCIFVIFPLSTVGMNNGAEKLENSKGGIPDQVAQLEEQVRSLTELVTNQQELIESIQQQLVAQTEAIKVNGDKILELRTDTEQQKENLSNYINHNNDNIEDLITDINSIQNRVGTNEHAIRGLNENYNFLSARLQGIIHLLEGTPAEVYTMSGKAVFMDGSPIRETVYHLFQGLDKKSSGHTGHNGNFTIGNVSSGSYTLKIGNESNPFVQIQIEVNGENVNGLILQSSVTVYSVEGKALFANGLPILSYGIYYTGDNGISGRNGSVQSDGSFTLTGLPAGKYTVQFGSKTHPLAEEEIEVVSDIENLEVRSNLEAVTVSGQLVDSNDNPFTFSHSMKDLNKNLEYSNLKSFPSEVGQFVYYLPKNSTYTFNIHHNGYQLSNQTLNVVGEDMEDVKFKLTHPTYSLSGKVVDSNGKGIYGKDIHIRFHGGTYGAGWRTDINGDFLLEGLAPGEYELIIGNHNNPEVVELLTITDENLSNWVLVIK